MPDVKMDAVPGDDQIDNMLKDVMRVFVIQVICQTYAASGAGASENLITNLDFKLPPPLMIKIMKIVGSLMSSETTLSTLRLVQEVYTKQTLYATAIGTAIEEGLQMEPNTLYAREQAHAAANSSLFAPQERNWEPGKILAKNELTVSQTNVRDNTAAATIYITNIVDIHYQVARIDDKTADAMVWNSSTLEDD